MGQGRNLLSWKSAKALEGHYAFLPQASSKTRGLTQKAKKHKWLMPVLIEVHHFLPEDLDLACFSA